MKKLIVVVGLMLVFASCDQTIGPYGVDLVREKFPNSRIYYSGNTSSYEYVVIDSTGVKIVSTYDGGRAISNIEFLLEQQ
jgi:hypothetical protein